MNYSKEFGDQPPEKWLGIAHQIAKGVPDSALTSMITELTAAVGTSPEPPGAHALLQVLSSQREDLIAGRSRGTPPGGFQK